MSTITSSESTLLFVVNKKTLVIFYLHLGKHRINPYHRVFELLFIQLFELTLFQQIVCCILIYIGCNPFQYKRYVHLFCSISRLDKLCL